MIDETFIDHVAGDLHRGEAGAFAGARLQEVELSRLDREFDVLHVAIVAFEFLVDLDELRVDVRHRLFKRFFYRR